MGLSQRSFRLFLRISWCPLGDVVGLLSLKPNLGGLRRLQNLRSCEKSVLWLAVLRILGTLQRSCIVQIISRLEESQSWLLFRLGY